MDEFDEGIWSYEMDRARSGIIGGIVAIILGALVLAGSAGLAFVFFSVNGDFRISLALAGAGLAAAVTGGGMISNGLVRRKRLVREREEESHRVPRS